MSLEQIFKTYEKQLKEFEDWIDQNPRLPKNINKLLLLRFLKVYDFDLEQAKNLLVLNLETRKKYPELFKNRDVQSEDFQAAISTVMCIPLRKNTKDNNKVTLFRLTTSDASKFSYKDVSRMILATLDCRLVQCDENELINGEITLVDVSNFSFKHFTNIISNFGCVRAYLNYTQEAAPTKIAETHFVNCPSIINNLMSYLKPILKKEVRDTLMFHSSLESLYEYVPRDILPEDLGGTAKKLSQFHLDVKEMLEKHRDYLLNEDNWKIID